MNVEPTDIDRERLAALVSTAWDLGPLALDHLPVGFGAHHYVARGDGGRWFVTVDEIESKTWLGDDAPSRLAGLGRALRAAAALRDWGLRFAHAPVVAASGDVLVALDERYAVSVFDWIEGGAPDWNVDVLPPPDRIELFGLLGSLHSVDPATVDLHTDRLEVPHRSELLGALDDLDRPWPGPFGERARQALLRARAGVRRSLDAFDELTARAASAPKLLTHGEPHGANLLRAADGRLRLIDWDTVALAPRERDLAVAMPRDDREWTAYVGSGGSTSADPDLVRLYRLHWALTEVSLEVRRYRGPHDDDDDARTAWGGFSKELEFLARAT